MKTLLLVALLFPLLVQAGEEEYKIVIKDHRFYPVELNVESGKKIVLRIENQDDTPEEFDSDALNREKRIQANANITLYVGPLETGRYPFAGELHEASAQGVIIAK